MRIPLLLCAALLSAHLSAAPAATPSAQTTEPAPPAHFREPPHLYWQTPLADPFSKLLASSQNAPGEILLPGDSEKERLLSLLNALQIPPTSQLLVYSATSLQSGLILPTNPRALFFNEDTYVGYVPGGKIEVASIDPRLGPIFHLSKSHGEHHAFARSERCMNCHAGAASKGLPGMLTESVIPTRSGASLDAFRRDTVGHHVSLKERFGGWHVTGPHAADLPLANLLGEGVPGHGYRTLPNPPGSQFDWAPYPSKESDLFTHLVHEHQLGFHNLVTLAAYRTREALSRGNNSILPQDRASLDSVASQLIAYLLFRDEAPLPKGGIQTSPAFLRDFLAKKKATPDGRSLRDVDLQTRLFRNRCSYMIYTESFQKLPSQFLHPLLEKLRLGLASESAPPEFLHLSLKERRTLLDVLSVTGVFP